VAPKTKYAHGVFSWVHLGTTDPAAAKHFYGALFGWQFEDMPAGPTTYTFIRLKDGRSVGGLFALTEELLSQGVPPRWMPFVNVTSADEVAKKSTQVGGKVFVEPMDIMDDGRIAGLQDPTGAHIDVWQAKTHLGADAINETGAMCWTELMTPDTKAAERFYSAIFGWTTELIDTSEDSSYTIFKVGNTRVGGMMARPPRLKDVPPHWLTYFAVSDCDATATKAGNLGAKSLMPPTDIPNIGRFAVCQDGQDAVFAIFKSK
jgi:predicted enzyme related to lactoylglutathione lyase